MRSDLAEPDKAGQKVGRIWPVVDIGATPLRKATNWRERAEASVSGFMRAICPDDRLSATVNSVKVAI